MTVYASCGKYNQMDCLAVFLFSFVQDIVVVVYSTRRMESLTKLVAQCPRNSAKSISWEPLFIWDSKKIFVDDHSLHFGVQNKWISVAQLNGLLYRSLSDDFCCKKRKRGKKNWRVNPLSPSAPHRFHCICFPLFFLPSCAYRSTALVQRASRCWYIQLELPTRTRFLTRKKIHNSLVRRCVLMCSTSLHIYTEDCRIKKKGRNIALAVHQWQLHQLWDGRRVFHSMSIPTRRFRQVPRTLFLPASSLSSFVAFRRPALLLPL